jgi:hypothetical protein
LNRQQIYDAVYADLRRESEVTDMIEMQSILGELEYTLKNLDEWTKLEKAGFILGYSEVGFSKKSGASF